MSFECEKLAVDEPIPVAPFKPPEMITGSVLVEHMSESADGLTFPGALRNEHIRVVFVPLRMPEVCQRQDLVFRCDRFGFQRPVRILFRLLPLIDCKATLFDSFHCVGRGCAPFPINPDGRGADKDKDDDSE